MQILKTFKSIIVGFVDLLYPNVCLSCGKELYGSEHYICTECLLELPHTYFQSTRKNIITELLKGRIINLQNAYSFLFFYKHTIVQKIIHAIKYSGTKELAYDLGNYLAQDIKDSEFKNADLLIPVPLHPLKLKIRGYNQSEWLARGISEVLNIPIEKNNLVRIINTQTQTLKGKEQRWYNVRSAFDVHNPKKLKNKHIVLIDDVLTTGATIEACANTLERKVENVKISILTLATANKLI